MSSTRISARFAECAEAGRAALVAYFVAGDPDIVTSQSIMNALPAAGADLIELGMPFSDPMADGPTIEAAGHRSLKNGHTLKKTLLMVKNFREQDADTPIILMGYYNPIYSYGSHKFLIDAKNAGLDGLIIVDLPPEEDAELCLPALEAGLSFIRLTTPTTDVKRLPKVLKNTSGFVYHVSITGITGAALSDHDAVRDAVKTIKLQAGLPVVVGFGIKTAQDAELMAQNADGVAVGTALVAALDQTLNEGKATQNSVEAVLTLVRSLAEGIAKARVQK